LYEKEELESGIKKMENMMDPYQMWASPANVWIPYEPSPEIQRVTRAMKGLDNPIPKRRYGKYA